MGDPVTLISKWIEGLMIGWGLSAEWITFFMTFIGVIAIALVVLVIDIFLVWFERKGVARFQDRLGPNRLGPFGLIQPVADVIKLLIKENITPQGADRVIYNLAPILALATVISLWAVIPLSPTIIGTDVNVGVLYIVAIGSISTLGILMAGWSSNNKYALLAAFRTVAQMVSYEIPMVISILIPVILANSMGINQIVKAQGVWFIILAPVSAIIFLISNQAELGRAPFDIPEAESEIVAGFHIEYTGMKFGMFYAGELLHALTVSGLFASLFLGGWRGFGTDSAPIVGIFWFFLKAFFIYWVVMWLKYSFPRVRIDQMLNFNWKFLTPLALTALIVTAILDKLLQGTKNIWIYSGTLFLANIVIILITLFILNSIARGERKRVAEPKPIALSGDSLASTETLVNSSPSS
jgi:NADH-quinone oxidoreductase subunit H